MVDNCSLKHIIEESDRSDGKMEKKG